MWQQKDDEEGVPGTEFQFYNSVNYEAGLQLLQELFSREDEEGIEKNWFEFPDLSDDAKKTLLDSGFSLEEKESRDLYKTIGEIAENKAFKIKIIPPYIIPLSKLDPVGFERGIARLMFAGHKGTESDLSSIPMEWFEQDISCCLITDDRVTGMVLIRKCADGILMPVLLYTSGVEGAKELLKMLGFSVQAARNKYGEETRVRLRRHDGKSFNLAAHLFPGATGEKVTAGIRMRS